MTRILVVGEDAVCCSIGERLVQTCLPAWELAQASINTGGVTKLVRGLSRYLQQARHVQPVLCNADTDRRCVVDLLESWLPHGQHPNLLLRLAVTEAESWLIAVRHGLATFLAVQPRQLADRPDELMDPKGHLIQLARKSRRRIIRNELVSPYVAERPGPGYNVHLSEFVRRHWDAARAADRSPSLRRAIEQLSKMRRRGPPPQ